MKSRDFAYWLQGYLELSDKKEGFTSTQVEVIRNHLNMVFEHEIDPSFPNKETLQEIHEGKKGKSKKPKTSKSTTPEEVNKVMEKLTNDVERLKRVRTYSPPPRLMC